MNKADPDIAVDRFEIEVIQLQTDWVGIDVALVSAGAKVALRRRAATDALLRVAVTWESFLSEWWISAVNRDPGPLLTDLERKIRDYATSSCQLTPADLSSTIVTRANLTVEEVRKILDPDLRNVVFRGLNEFKKQGAKQLGDPYKSKVLSIPESRWTAAELVRSLRNALSHRSRASLDELQTILRRSGVKASLQVAGTQRIDVAGIGRYLAAKPPGSLSERIAILHEDLRRLGGLLRTY